MTEEAKHTPTMLPLIAEFNGKSGCFTFLGVRPDGNNRSSDGRGSIFHINAGLREDDDVVAFPRLDESIVAFADYLLEAVNSYAELTTLRIKLAEVERALPALRGALTIADTLPWPDTLSHEARRALEKRRADIVEAIATLSQAQDPS